MIYPKISLRTAFWDKRVDKREIDVENLKESPYLFAKVAREDETTCKEFRTENDCKPAAGPNFDLHAGT